MYIHTLVAKFSECCNMPGLNTSFRCSSELGKAGRTRDGNDRKFELWRVQGNSNLPFWLGDCHGGATDASFLRIKYLHAMTLAAIFVCSRWRYLIHVWVLRLYVDWAVQG
jgi:hypothetical protein